ncbi:GNAT family N-acetyltransferase [Microvirga flavescens]|uniref:GNAT family N-acetyltransferase n=1 Tax=Microvirga flavescens TaxID=2249811 RepID=UPI000DD724DF|nr:GNAT family N-acetyltransferase [Microvirga flavescens]
MSVNAGTLEIRLLLAKDRPVWEELWQGYLAFYESTLAPEVTALTWARLNDPAEPMHCLVAALDGKVVGITHFIYHRSTWTTGNYCYLQDLFTAKEARNRGVARALIEAVYDRAKESSASRVYWLTHETNTTAQALYDKVASRSGFIQYRKVF